MHRVYALLYAAAVMALAAASGHSSSSIQSHVPGVRHHPGGVGSGGGDGRSDGQGLTPLPASSGSLLMDDKSASVTMGFFISFMSVCAGSGLVALIVVLCAYCREYKLLETSSDSDTESVHSRATSHSSVSADSDSSSDLVQAYETHRPQPIAPPPTAGEVMAAAAYEEANDETELRRPVIQADTQSNEPHDSSVPADPTLGPSDDAATRIRFAGSRLSLASSRRGSYRRAR
ncbi:hypothetical protein GH5_02597 [Leishmania sp. Ghana 2012 LV757]|uniref:hypothetical protein n=1 Tax=Leishmania sp. Ghana 2012 LV757 TaxID=2803181 RepID=UPI001B587F2B|nr:hypothetical protein GH5_02597 [Leishmania sp. Ghana 2012 LV757]